MAAPSLGEANFSWDVWGIEVYCGQQVEEQLSRYKSLFLQLKWPYMAGGIKIYTNLEQVGSIRYAQKLERTDGSACPAEWTTE